MESPMCLLFSPSPERPDVFAFLSLTWEACVTGDKEQEVVVCCGGGEQIRNPEHARTSSHSQELGGPKEHLFL